MRVLVIAEDPRLDQYMLKPLVRAALAHIGKPKAKVQVCQDASQRGDSTVIDKNAIREIIEIYPMNDLYILCVDRDCRDQRNKSLENVERTVNEGLGRKKFIAVCGVEELEVWVLAGIEDFTEPWEAVQKECHPKERYFEPYVRRRGVQDTPGRGRKVLGEEAATRYAARVRNICSEIRRCEVRSI